MNLQSMLKFSPRCRTVCGGDGGCLYIESQLLNRSQSVTVNFLACRVAECQSVAQLDFLTDFRAPDTLIKCGDYIAVKVDTTEHKMTMWVRLVKVTRHDILRIGDTHAT